MFKDLRVSWAGFRAINSIDLTSDGGVLMASLNPELCSSRLLPAMVPFVRATLTIEALKYDEKKW